MNYGASHIATLMYLSFSDNLTEEQAKELNIWLDSSTINKEIFERLKSDNWLYADIVERSPDKMAQLKKELFALVQTEKSTNLYTEATSESSPKEGKKIPVIRSFFRNSRQWAAIVIFLLVTSLAYFYLANLNAEKLKGQETNTALQQAVKPGQEGAILTLSDGSIVILDSLGNGSIPVNGATAMSLQDGQLFVDNDKSGATHLMNTLSTPKGRRFQISLPDGSRAWLNAESFIRFPSVFRGEERSVEISGEVYFEIAQNPTAPFIVRTAKNMTVKVLGTHFNVNAYNDESVVKTTLLEGSVKLLAGDINDADVSKTPTLLLKPGEQPELTNEKFNVRKVDVETSIAWVKGIFDFKGLDLNTALKQIARWYDVAVVCDAVNGAVRLHGSAYQSGDLKDILEVLSFASGTQITLEDRTVFVTKK